MNFAGLQKLTLLDYPGVVSCIVFTQGCNFRCPFCHNSSLLPFESEGDIIEEKEILSFLKQRKGLLEGVVITGGEPLLHKDILSFIKEIKALDYVIKLDTNGTNPVLLKELVANKLIDYVAMDIKNSPDGYSLATGLNPDLKKIGESKDFLLNERVNYEFRTTLVKGLHEEKDLKPMAQWIKGAKRYFLQTYKDSGEIYSPNGLSAFTEEETEHFLQLILPIVPSASIRKI